MNWDVNTMLSMLPAHVKKSDLLAKIAEMEAEQAREKAMHKKMVIAGAAIAATAAAATAAYMVLRKKEITLQLNCSDRLRHRRGDACCWDDDDEPVTRRPRRNLGDVLREKAMMDEDEDDAPFGHGDGLMDRIRQHVWDHEAEEESGCENCTDAGEGCFSCEESSVIYCPPPAEAPACEEPACAEADAPCCCEDEPKAPCNDCE